MVSSLPSLKALFDRCVPARAGRRVSGKVAAFSAALPERKRAGHRTLTAAYGRLAA
jgi:hypothetical protein